MREINRLNRIENNYYEQLWRLYPELDSKIYAAKHRNNIFASEYYSKLKFDIEFSFEKLSDELQDVVRQYVWGEFSYIDSWKEIGELCFGSMRQGGTARAKICESLAEVRGYLI